MSNSKYLLALGYILKITLRINDLIVKIQTAWGVSDLKSNRSSEDAENHRESVSISVTKKKILYTLSTQHKLGQNSMSIIKTAGTVKLRRSKTMDFP